MAEKIHAMHGRDHCPGGADPIPCLSSAWPQAVLASGSTTAGDDTWMPVPFYDAYKRNDPNDVYFTWSQTDTGDTGNDRWELKVAGSGVGSGKNGRYMLDALVSWDQVGTGPFVGAAFFEIVMRNGADTSDTIVLQATQHFWRDTPDGPMPIYQRITALWDPNAFWTGDGGTILRPRAKQITGVNRTLGGMYLKLVWYDDIGVIGDWTTATVV